MAKADYPVPIGREELSTPSSKTFWWIGSRERERERSISRDSILRARAITRLPSFGKMNPLSLAFYFQSRLHMDRHTRAYIRVSIVKWTYTWFIFLWKISRDRHLLFLFPRRVEKNATPRRISMMNICVVLGLPRIKVGLIGSSIHRRCIKYRWERRKFSLHLLFQKDFERMLNK